MPEVQIHPNSRSNGASRGPSLARFQVARSTLLFDRFMQQFIQIGGVAIVTLVLGLFVFMLWQVLPLLRSARVHSLNTLPAPPLDYVALSSDEYAEHPVLIASSGAVLVLNSRGDSPPIQLEPSFSTPKTISAVSYDPQSQTIAFGASDGTFTTTHIRFDASFDTGKRALTATLETRPFLPLSTSEAPLSAIARGEGRGVTLVAAIQAALPQNRLLAARLEQDQNLFGEGEPKLAGSFDLTSQLTGQPERLLVSHHADALYVATDAGKLFYFAVDGGGLVLRQILEPFSDLPDRRIGSLDFLLGDVSLVLTSHTGENRIFSLFYPPANNLRLLGQTKTLPPLAGPAEFYSASLRNKSFLLGHGRQLSLRFATTESVRWQTEIDTPIRLASLSPKGDRILLLDTKNRIHLLALDDPHPEASLQGLFGKIWYEGSDAPKYEWQSTGGTDEFEPKLSLVPVIFGTFKGTVYALLFALPVALLGAFYTSQFAPPHLRTWIKPIMEIMASLPSVVLGFLAALWLAPLLETRVPSVLLVVLFLPSAALLAGWIWANLSISYRAWLAPGYEFAALTPILLIVAWIAWQLGPLLEQWAFTVTDPASGARLADFRLWWPEFTGSDFQQRNSLVVGFVMGLAVIPIIFTIAEDSLSNVPSSLRSASLALGASRWQTAWRIVLPSASAGIFSAVMIGLGRAVGETMIVVMATGNTPIMDFNIFSGMRTLSANIAVELPEAPQFGTLYRTLFLGGLILFLLTFVINTIAEVLRQKLREKYKHI